MSADNAYAVELKGLTFKRGTRSIFNNVDNDQFPHASSSVFSRQALQIHSSVT
jgi:hypothetical protein